jgi:CheY-like chemotaxis protein
LARQVIPQAVIIDSNSILLDPPQSGSEADTASNIESTVGLATKLAELGRSWGLLQVPIMSCPLPGEGPLRRRSAVDGYLIKPVARQNLWDVVRGFGESIEHILIVDDNRDFVRLLRQMLANPLRPYRIESAYSGEEALANLRLSPPDLVLLDLGLPDLNGVQVVEILRAHPILRSIPIVVVSAQDELDGLEVLQGALTVTKAGGLLPGDLIRWLGASMGTSQRSPIWQRTPS